MEDYRILNGYQIDVLSTEYLVLLTLSVIGSFSVLVVSIVRWRHLKEQVHLLVQLALADLLAALILLSSSVMNKVNIDNSEVICQYILPLSLTFNFISFLLVVVYAWKSKNAIQGWRAEDEGGQTWCRRRIVAVPVYAIVWLFPIAIYLSYVLTSIKTTSLIPFTDQRMVRNDSKYCTSCILFLHVWRDYCSKDERNHDISIGVFLFLVVIAVMLSCSVIYYKVGKWYERNDQEGLFPVEGDGRSRRRFKSVFSNARNMVIVILFCWAPALILLSTLMIWTNIEQYSLFGLYMIQAASVSLQGFLNSMVYAWRRPNFTEAVLGENTPLVTHNRLAFFDESLRSSL
ncbi:transmembrane protein 116 [Cottoperca gobio]|uniref:Transmembrane protein 116 n=1 Tax=Cottoperca gobio TaxID=56716 RepID=A0A6J2PVV8_COTGO|nr:transmembrane protein 116-like [Cottoperca gobio]